MISELGSVAHSELEPLRTHWRGGGVPSPRLARPTVGLGANGDCSVPDVVPFINIKYGLIVVGLGNNTFFHHTIH